MALIPLKQTVTVTPATDSTDRFDRPIMGDPYELKCRVQNSTKIVQSEAVGLKSEGGGKEALSSCQIYFDKLPSITMQDIIEFTDELGVKHTYKPLSIEIKRGLDGKAWMTIVNV